MSERLSGKKKKTADPEKAKRRDIYEWIRSFISALIICVILFVFFFRLIGVRSVSMNPTLYEGDMMLVSNLFYKPKPSDVVVFRSDTYDSEKALVKRVVATGGQKINIDFINGVVYVDDQPIVEDYVAEPTYNKLDFVGPQTVPEGSIFVMGDNRNMSNDSRDKRIGMLDERLILGRAIMIVHPVDRLGFIKR